MPREIVKTLYKFDELNDEQKEKAREKWRVEGLEYDWWECVYELAVEVGAALGIEIDSTKSRHNIFFSGFYSQGDGASFTGTYRYQPGWRKKLLKICPKEEDVFNIGDALQEVQRRHQYGLAATIKIGRGMYSHSGVMDVTVDGPDRGEDQTVIQNIRWFADWIYSELEQEHNFRMSDEATDENIRCNEVEYDLDELR